jgi:hypothetical protein
MIDPGSLKLLLRQAIKSQSLIRDVSLFLKACPTKLALGNSLERSWERDSQMKKSKCEKKIG